MNEGFAWALEAKDTEGKINRLNEWAESCQCLVPVVRIGVGAEKHNWDLPEGMPDMADIEKDIPEGMGETSIQMEWRRIVQFIQPTSNLNNLPAIKREGVWINILEGIHHEEAALLTAVKDGKLLELYPSLEDVLAPLGITEYNKPTKTKTKARAKKGVKKVS